MSALLDLAPLLFTTSVCLWLYFVNRTLRASRDRARRDLHSLIKRHRTLRIKYFNETQKAAAVATAAADENPTP